MENIAKVVEKNNLSERDSQGYNLVLQVQGAYTGVAAGKVNKITIKLRLLLITCQPSNQYS